MKIIAVSHDLPGVTDEQFAPHLKAEALRAWELLQANVVREIHFRADESSAVLILECASVEAADAYLSTLPLVREHLICFEFIPLLPYQGFARLFAQS